MFLSHDTIFPNGSVTFVSTVVLSGKNFLVNRSCQKFQHIWLQDSELTAKVGSMPAAYPADLTKASCEVCNNAIIA